MRVRRILGSLADIADGDARGFDPEGTGRDSVFVVRKGFDLHAYVNACPHMDGAPMAWRKDAYLSGDRSHIVCHAHGARFEIETGLCVLGPCEGQTLTRAPIETLPGGAIVVASPP